MDQSGGIRINPCPVKWHKINKLFKVLLQDFQIYELLHGLICIASKNILFGGYIADLITVGVLWKRSSMEAGECVLCQEQKRVWEPLYIQESICQLLNRLSKF